MVSALFCYSCCKVVPLSLSLEDRSTFWVGAMCHSPGRAPLSKGRVKVDRHRRPPGLCMAMEPPPLDHTPMGRKGTLMKDARAGTFQRPKVPLQCYVPHPGDPPVRECPREKPEYQRKLLEVLKLSGNTKDEIYNHLSDADLAALKECVLRCSAA